LRHKSNGTATMSKFQNPSTNQDDVDEDLKIVDSGSPQIGVDGVITDDGEQSISAESDIETPTGLSVKQKAAQQERSTLGVNETRAIFCLRLIVLLTLIMFGLSLSISVYFLGVELEVHEFEEQFGFYEDQVIERFNRQLERKLNSMDALSTDMTSYAKSSGSEFPFVTVPDFEFRGANARISGDTVFTFYMPYITEDMKVPWEAYAAANLANYSQALDSEQASKVAQDLSFGLTTPEINYTPPEYAKEMGSEHVDVAFNTSVIWYTGIDGKEVSWWSISSTLCLNQTDTIPNTIVCVPGASLLPTLANDSLRIW
jgi:hypothetical protein